MTPGKRAILGMLAALALCLALPAGAGASQPLRRMDLPQLEIKAGHSRLVHLPTNAKRVSVGRPEVADVLVINPRQIYINAKEPGTTNITLWDSSEAVLGVVEVRVARDLSRLKEQLAQILPGEPVEVREMEGSVVLSGRVSSPQAKKRAEAVAAAFAPKKVTSVLEIGAVKQIMLKVRFAEVSRTATKKLNINLGFADAAGNFIFTFLGGLVTPVPPENPSNLFDLSLSTKMTGAGGLRTGSGRLLGFLEALKENGLAKILAEPNLVASSGNKAEFLAGGEYPIPVPQKENITIEFKKFGVQLTFLPRVLSTGKIQLEVEPEVSDLDFTTAVAIQGFAVPGLRTRRAKTQLELDDGQSFAIAGLFRDDITQAISKVPMLGDIPILGALFRSTSFQNDKTELVIVVTPEIMRAGMGAPGRLPTDNLIVPDDFDLMLMGKQVRIGEASPGDGGVPRSLKEMEGKFGDALVY